MAWEVYRRQFVRSGDPGVTITKMGRIAMNLSATSILQKENATHVVLLWDGEESKCAIKITNSNGNLEPIASYSEIRGMGLDSRL